jgi:serine acetyltransferase
MNSQLFIQQIRDLIARDEMKAALEQLRVFLEKTPKLDEILHQSGRFEHIRREIRQGLVSHAEATLEQNKLRAALLDLLAEIETQGQEPALRAEIERAVSVVHSKNVVVGSSISAGGDVHIGDRNVYFGSHTITEQQTTQTMNNDPSKAIWLSVLIAAFGVAIGFLGELMPDAFKAKVEAWATSTLGTSFLTIWVIGTALVVLVFLVLIWIEALKNNGPGSNQASNNVRNIKQGPKSIYIENNNGPIKIE